MRIFRLTAIFSLFCYTVAAYQYPVSGVKGLHSASFAEMRSNHFHSGIDIKTDGVEGKEIVASEDGYISRVVYSAYGYGLALYVTHPHKGTMTVYGHLKRFADKIDKLVSENRFATRSNNVDLQIKEGLFPVSKGEVIGYSGNTGNSFGPHLHYELRNQAGTHTYNIVRRGLFQPKDNIPPRLLALHYIQVDTLQGVAIESVPQRYLLKKVGTKYIVTDSVKVGRCGYFLLECRDNQSDNYTNRFGVYRVSQSVNGECNFTYKIDSFAFADSRLCNLVSYYPLQRGAKCEIIRLGCVSDAVAKFYTTLKDRGTIVTAVAEKKSIKIEVEDDCGNISTLCFDVVGDRGLTKVLPDNRAVVAGAGHRVDLSHIGVKATIFPDALYYPTFCSVENCMDKDTIADVVVLSNRCRIMDSNIPLQRAVYVSIDAKIPLHLQSRSCIALKNRTGRYFYLGGYYAAGRVRVATRSIGEMCVVADTIAPKVQPLWSDKENMRSKKGLEFQISDNFSGISKYDLYIDGKWFPLDFLPIKGIAYYNFDTTLPAGDNTQHGIEVHLKDKVGNISQWSGTFYR